MDEDQQAIENVVQGMIDTIDNTKQHNQPQPTPKRGRPRKDQEKQKQRTHSNSSIEIIDCIDPTNSNLNKRKRKPASFYSEHQRNYPTNLTRSKIDDNTNSKRLKIHVDYDKNNKLTSSYSKKRSPKALAKESIKARITRNSKKDEEKKAPLPKAKSTTNTDDPVQEAVANIKRKQLRNRLEVGLKLSNLKQRIEARNVAIHTLTSNHQTIDTLKQQIAFEQARLQSNTTMNAKERGGAEHQQEDVNVLSAQLQSENNRLRKINVHLQNNVIALDKKLRDKDTILEKLGIDTNEMYQRLGPYSSATKLDEKKARQRLLFNCADVLAAGSIEDSLKLVADLYEDLQLDPSINRAGRGLPVLAESHKKCRREDATTKRAGQRESNQLSVGVPTTSNLNPVVARLNPPKVAKVQPRMKNQK